MHIKTIDSGLPSEYIDQKNKRLNPKKFLKRRYAPNNMSHFHDEENKYLDFSKDCLNKLTPIMSSNT